jgi:hypothetical protein
MRLYFGRFLSHLVTLIGSGFGGRSEADGDCPDVHHDDVARRAHRLHGHRQGRRRRLLGDDTTFQKNSTFLYIIFRGKSLSTENSVEFLEKKNLQNFFRGKFHFFPTFFLGGGKFSAEFPMKFSQEKMYEKLARLFELVTAKIFGRISFIYVSAFSTKFPKFIFKNSFGRNTY